MKPRVYVASRLRASSAPERHRNQELVRLACAHAMALGVRPFAPHLLYPAWLDPQDPAQDAAGIEMALADLAECSELWLYTDHRGFSQGMHAELKAWREACGAPPRTWALGGLLASWLGTWPLVGFECGSPVFQGPSLTLLRASAVECFAEVGG